MILATVQDEDLLKIYEQVLEMKISFRLQKHLQIITSDRMDPIVHEDTMD